MLKNHQVHRNMEFCLTTNNKDIVIEGIKDLDLKQKVQELTNSYLGELYTALQKNACQGPMDAQVSGLFIFEPHVENCCICMENCSQIKHRPVTITSCECLGKYYHETCLRRWFSNKKICPTCRKDCNGKGYKSTKFTNPYKTSKDTGGVRISSSQFAYQCCGGTHAKKSCFKSLFSALKHAKDKHDVDINIRKARGSRFWVCNVDHCGSTISSDEDMLQHLQRDHHLNVIVSR